MKAARLIAAATPALVLSSLLLLDLAAAPQQAAASSKQAGAAPQWSYQEVRLLRSLSPLPALPPAPSNRFADSAAAARFGQALFFDPALSANGEVACATCHDPEQGWSDAKPLAEGIRQVGRNTPTSLLAAYGRWQFWDGRADSMWAQARWPLEHPDEMGFTRSGLVRYLARTPALRAQYHALFGPLPEGCDDPARFPDAARPPLPQASDPFDPGPNLEQLTASDPAHARWFAMDEADRNAATQVVVHVGKALEAYQRRLITGPSPFDRFVAAFPQQTAEAIAARAPSDGPAGILGPAAQRGLKFFIGPGKCINCHFGPMLSGGEFHNLGLALPAGAAFDSGRVDGIRTVRVDPLNGRGVYSDAQDWDSNVKLRYLKYDQHTFGAYKTPSLRNVARTAPYMHDGRFASLEEVLEFYSKLPGQPPSGHREETLVPLDLSPAQIADLSAFLRSLTGSPVAAEWRRP